MKLVKICLGLMILFTSPVLGQGNYPFLTFDSNPFTDLSFLGAGARAHAMGGAFYAVSDDPSAISWNPAGLTQMNLAQMSVSFHHTRAKSDYNGAFSPGLPGFAGDINQSVDQLAFAGVVIPFEFKNRQFVGSASVPNTVLEFRGVDFRDSLDFRQEINGRLSMGSVGLATKIRQDLSVGLAVNIYGHGYDRNGLATFQATPPPDDTVLLYRPRIRSSFSGWNFTLGGLLELDRIRLAAVFKSPFTENFPLKEERDVQLISDYVIRGVVNPFNDQPLGILYNTEWEWILPSILGFGASFQVTDDFLVAADFDYKPFSKAWVKVQSDSLNPNSGFEARDLHWNDINQFRIGGEYKLKIKRYTIPLRAGYRNDPKPYENVDNAYAFLQDHPFSGFFGFGGETGVYYAGSGSQVKGNVISFGSGVAFGQVAFDITWEFASYEFEENGFLVTDIIDPFFGIAQGTPFSRTSDVSNNRVIFNFTGVF
jgi:long-subunit fatty acid transport protein